MLHHCHRDYCDQWNQLTDEIPAKSHTRYKNPTANVESITKVYKWMWLKTNNIIWHLYLHGTIMSLPPTQVFGLASSTNWVQGAGIDALIHFKRRMMTQSLKTWMTISLKMGTCHSPPVLCWMAGKSQNHQRQVSCSINIGEKLGRFEGFHKGKIPGSRRLEEIWR